jgi:hypothetical protein
VHLSRSPIDVSERESLVHSRVCKREKLETVPLEEERSRQNISLV